MKKSINYSILFIFTILFLLACPNTGLAANHLILIDTSYSMNYHLDPTKKNESGTSGGHFKDFFIKEVLGTREIFQDGEAIIFRVFNDKFKGEKKVTFRLNDPDRLYPSYGEESKINLNQETRARLQERISKKLRYTHYYTDLLEGLELGYEDIKHYFDPSKPSIIWMITDNEQDLGEIGDKNTRHNIAPFYKESYDNPCIEMTYFIPIVSNLNHAKENLICYAFLHYANNEMKAPPAACVREFEAKVETMNRVLNNLPASKIKYNKAIRCKPASVESFALDKKVDFIADNQISFLQEGLLLIFKLAEGIPLMGKLHLRFKSQSEYWKINKAQLKDPILIFTNNKGSVFAEPPNSVLRIQPREITLEPFKATQRVYEAIMAYGDEGLFIPKVSKFSLKSFLPGNKDILNAILRFNLPVDMDSQLSLEYHDLPQILKAIQMLDKIKDFMLPQLGAHRTFDLEAKYPVEFHIDFALWRKLVFWLSFPLLLFIIILISLAAQKKVNIEWGTETSKSERISLPYFRKAPIKIGSTPLGELRLLPLFGLKFYPAAQAKLNNQSKKMMLRTGLNKVSLESSGKKFFLNIKVLPAKSVSPRGKEKRAFNKQSKKSYY